MSHSLWNNIYYNCQVKLIKYSQEHSTMTATATKSSRQRCNHAANTISQTAGRWNSFRLYEMPQQVTERDAPPPYTSWSNENIFIFKSKSNFFWMCEIMVVHIWNQLIIHCNKNNKTIQPRCEATSHRKWQRWKLELPDTPHPLLHLKFTWWPLQLIMPPRLACLSADTT